MRPDRDYIQVDPGLSYGLVEYRRIQHMLAQHSWSSRRFIPHGGHQFSLHVAAALKLGGNESYPASSSPPAASPTTPSSKAAGRQDLAELELDVFDEHCSTSDVVDHRHRFLCPDSKDRCHA